MEQVAFMAYDNSGILAAELPDDVAINFVAGQQITKLPFGSLTWQLKKSQVFRGFLDILSMSKQN